MLDQIITMDHRVFELINHGMTNSFADWFFPWFTDLYKTTGFMVFVLLGIGFQFRKSRPKSVRLVLALLIALTFSDGIAYRIIKPIAQRSRPEFVGIPVNLKTHSHSGYSFPSNHAANSATMATVLCIFYPLLSPLWVLLALLISFSRIYVGVHFPIDVLVGSALGCISGYAAVYIVQRALRSKRLPKNVASFFREQS